MKRILVKPVLAITLTPVFVFINGCTPSIQGTYANGNGSIVLDLKSGEKATLTFMGESKDCFYKQGKEQIQVVCDGDTTNFSVHDDGSLTGPGQIGRLQKSNK
jgi:hypothetical protein